MMKNNQEMLSIVEIAQAAKKAAEVMATKTHEQRKQALQAMADKLRSCKLEIIESNAVDMKREKAAGMKESLLDRLMLNEERIESMACALENLEGLPDPLGVVQQQRTLYNDIELKRISVPLGVVSMVYEARPNVTVDAAGICMKTGNACILRGGSAALHSNRILAGLLHEAAQETGMPRNCICLIDTTDRAATDELMSLHGLVDVLIPRGGTGLIKHCVEHSKVPVIETGTGNCHVYIHSSADCEMAKDIVINAKCRRMGVCNAAETLLVDEPIAQEVLSRILPALAERSILMHVDKTAQEVALSCGIKNTVPATEEDWEIEYLGPEIAIKCVSGLEQAIAHINHYGTKHSEAMISHDSAAEERFCAAIDAAAVYINASTAFTDGGEFGMGAEIGISTQKLHARGPFALEALTSYKYVLLGNGQVRA